jgi:putative DNA primase/helicase
VNAFTSTLDNDGFENLPPSANPKLVCDTSYKFVPERMCAENRWLAFQVVWNPDKAGFDKMPCNAQGQPANDPKTGVSLDTILAIVEINTDVLAGFYIEKPYILLDLDGCRDPITGAIEPWAQAIKEDVDSYTEISVSGTGIHIIVDAEKPGEFCRRGSVEIYSTGRAVALTGMQLPGTSNTVNKRDIKKVYDQMEAGAYVFGPEKSRGAKIKAGQSAQIESGGSAITTKLALLTTGDFTPDTKPFCVSDQHKNVLQYPSQSEAIGALLACLAYEHDCDPEKIEQGYLESHLSQISAWVDKWNRRGPQEIRRAIEFAKKHPRSGWSNSFVKLDAAGIDAGKNNAANPRTAADILVDYDETAIAEPEDSFPSFPRIPGSIGDLSDALCPDIPYQFKVAAVFAHFGLMRSGLDSLKDEPFLQTRFYITLIAPPGRGKSAVIKEVNRLMKSSLPGKYQVVPAVESGPALVDTFNDINRGEIFKAEAGTILPNPMAKIFLSPDEATSFFEKAKVTSNSRNTLLHELLVLYDGNLTGSRVRAAKIKLTIDNAHLAFLAGATPTGYSIMWTGTAACSGGLMSRFTPIAIKGVKVPSKQRPTDLERLTSAIQRLSNQAYSEGKLFSWSEDAFKLYDQWWASKDAENVHVTRIDSLVKQVLVILARTTDASEITEDLVRVATEIGDYVLYSREKYSPQDASNVVQAFENRIIEFHRLHGPRSVRQVRLSMHPERYAGGHGAFLVAYRNLRGTGILREVSKVGKLTLLGLDI